MIFSAVFDTRLSGVFKGMAQRCGLWVKNGGWVFRGACFLLFRCSCVYLGTAAVRLGMGELHISMGMESATRMDGGTFRFRISQNCR
jgi:hypothetical protein